MAGQGDRKAPVMKGRIPLYVMNLWCAYGKSDGHSQIVIGMPVIVAMGNAQRYTQVFFCARGNSHAHAHAYSHGHAHDYVHGHVYYWQTCIQVHLISTISAVKIMITRVPCPLVVSTAS